MVTRGNLLRLAFAALLVATAGFLYLVNVMLLLSLGQSDAAGNGMAQAMAFVLQGLLWVALALLLAFAGRSSSRPTLIAWLASPFAAAASIWATSETGPERHWLVMVPVLLPAVWGVLALVAWRRRRAEG